MNTKHGLVAAACVLSGSILLDAGKIAEAQQNSAADEYYAPQRTQAKPAPGLLPFNLRSPNQSSSEPAAKPIPTNVAPDAGSKLSGRSAKPMVRPSNRSVQATMYQQPGTPVQPANQNNGTPSPVQQQLEELYRRDGRQMPPMTLQQAPNTQPINGQNQNGQNQIRRPQPGAVSPVGQQNPNPAAAGVIPPKQASRVGFFSKLNPFKTKPAPAPAPLPQQPSHPIQNQNGVAGRTPNSQPFAQPKSLTAPGQFNAAPKQFNNASAARLQPAPVNQVPIAPAPPAQFEPKTETATAGSSSELSKVLPPVPGDPDYVAPKGVVTEDSTKPMATVDAAIENAFSDMPEEAADGAATAAKIQPDAVPTEKAESNPFSGLSLDDESMEVATPIAAKSASKIATDENDESDPLSLDDDKEVKSKIDLDSIPLPTEADDLIISEGKVAEEKPVDEPKIQVSAEEIDAKIKLIKERGELRGLKGFCAVALRDARDLKNALPEHTATYKGRTYYFSSDDAKVAFEKHPEQYAPVSGGNDIVLLKEKINKEGSLDHAVWFKDRLYLFTSQKTLEQFVASPSGFVISE